jgi:hypothetical protein
MTKSLITKLKRASMAALVCYLSLVMLTGCSTVEMHVVDPIQPVKFETLLSRDITLSVAVDFRGKISGEGREFWKWYQPEFQNDIKQALLTSGAFMNILTSDQCQVGNTERTLCVTVKPFNQPEKPFYYWIFAGIGAFFIACLLFIPLFFMTADITDRVIAEELLLDREGKEVGRAEVASEFEASIGFRKVGGAEGFRQVYGLNNKELANRLVLELKRHPHWFEAAR